MAKPEHDAFEREARDAALAGIRAARAFLGGEMADADFNRMHKRAQVGVAVGATYVRYLSAVNNRRLIDLQEADLGRELDAPGKRALAAASGA